MAADRTPEHPDDLPVYEQSHRDAATELRVSLYDLGHDLYACVAREDRDPAGAHRCLDLGPDPDRWRALAAMAGEMADLLDALAGQDAEREAA